MRKQCRPHQPGSWRSIHRTTCRTPLAAYCRSAMGRPPALVRREVPALTHSQPGRPPSSCSRGIETPRLQAFYGGRSDCVQALFLHLLPLGGLQLLIVPSLLDNPALVGLFSQCRLLLPPLLFVGRVVLDLLGKRHGSLLDDGSLPMILQLTSARVLLHFPAHLDLDGV